MELVNLQMKKKRSQNDDVCLNDKRHRFSFISGVAYSRL